MTTQYNYFPGLVHLRMAIERPPTAIRGKAFGGAVGFTSNARLATDAVGASVLTLTNIVIGSAIRIEVASTGALVEARTADTTTEVFTLDLYVAGSANNDLRIKVRKGSESPFYLPFETIAALTPAAQSIYIAQISDE